jgi:hypothetical protein
MRMSEVGIFYRRFAVAQAMNANLMHSSIDDNKEGAGRNTLLAVSHEAMRQQVEFMTMIVTLIHIPLVIH